MAVSPLLFILAVAFPSPSLQSSDTIDANKRAMRALGEYYDPRNDRFLGEMSGREGRCSADDGHVCLGGDPDRFICPPDVMCQPMAWLNDILDDLKASSAAHPDAGWVMGYTAYTLLKYGRSMEAFEVVRGCRSSEWYCALLEGYVLQNAGNSEGADPLFRRGLALAPDSVRCALVTAAWALDASRRDPFQTLPCSEQVAASDTIWWLADPLYSVPGNDRWSEHISRTVSTFLLYAPFDDARYQVPYTGEVRYFFPRWEKTLLDRIKLFRIPRGPIDSWEFDRSRRAPGPGWGWTSKKAARYHFVPDFVDNDLMQPAWRLDADMDDEGYTPVYASFYELPAQIARFRRADSMLVVVAGDMAGSPLAGIPDATAHLVLSNAPDSFPVQLASAIHDQRAVFLAQTPPTRYVTSFEVLSEAGMGRHRAITEPLATDGPGISDALLYQPTGGHDPDSVLIAAGMMLGTTTIAKGELDGVYWEIYGAPTDEPVTVEVDVRRKGGGPLGGITRVLPGVGNQERGQVMWTEPSPGKVFRNSVNLDLASLDPGDYVLSITARWAGQNDLVTERAFRVAG